MRNRKRKRRDWSRNIKSKRAKMKRLNEKLNDKEIKKEEKG